MRKVSKEIGIYSPIFIYAWLLYNLKSSTFFMIMLVISIILSILFIVSKDYVKGKLKIEEFGTYKSDDEGIVRGIGSQIIVMSIMAFFTYAQLANLAFSVFLAIGYLKYKNFEIIILLLTIIGGSALTYRLILLIFNIKGSRQLSINVKEYWFNLKRRKSNQSKPPVKSKRKRKSR